MSDQRYREEYVRRIHRVQDYMEQHIAESISVEHLAEVAGFSMYHFSRIFQGIMQESLLHYVNRMRMERALFYLAHRQDLNMTDIALELGFSDSAVFSRAFKNAYGVSPREYRQEYQRDSDATFLLSEYRGPLAKEKPLTSVTGQITIEEIPSMQAAYVRHTGSYDSLAAEYSKLMERLLIHAEKQHLLSEEKNKMLAIYHDNPEFTDEQQFRTSLCLTIPDGTVILEDGVLGSMELEGGLYAVGHFTIRPEQYPAAWDYMYQEWLTGSGYVPRNSYPFEEYCNDPSADEQHISQVNICVPIEPISF